MEGGREQPDRVTSGRYGLESKEAPDDKNTQGSNKIQITPGSKIMLIFSEGKLICNM